MNPSQWLVSQAEWFQANIKSPEVSVEAIVLPVLYFESWNRLKKEIESTKPDWVVSFGVSAKSKTIAVETTAKNRDDSRLPDNGGWVRTDEKILKEGPDQLQTTLPVTSLVSLKTKVPTLTSGHAGDYVCNHLFYQLMHHLPDRSKGGFIHVPACNTEKELESLRDSVLEILEVVVRS